MEALIFRESQVCETEVHGYDRLNYNASLCHVSCNGFLSLTVYWSHDKRSSNNIILRGFNEFAHMRRSYIWIR